MPGGLQGPTPRDPRARAASREHLSRPALPGCLTSPQRRSSKAGRVRTEVRPRVSGPQTPLEEARPGRELLPGRGSLRPAQRSAPVPTAATFVLGCARASLSPPTPHKVVWGGDGESSDAPCLTSTFGEFKECIE